MKPQLLILAAGIGSRFGGFKQMQPVGPNGEILLDYTIYDAHSAGFGNIVFVINKKLEHDFTGYMESRYGKTADFTYVFQEIDKIPEPFTVPKDRIKPWGTGHAVLAGQEAVRSPFAVINADDYYGPGAFKVLCKALTVMKPDSTEMVMVGFELSKTLSEAGTVSRGVCTVEKGMMLLVEEREKIRRTGKGIVHQASDGSEIVIAEDSIVSMNCWGFSPSAIFPLFERDFRQFLESRGSETRSEFYLPSVINDAVGKGAISVRVLRSCDQWFGLTYAEDCRAVKEYLLEKIREGVYPERLF